MVIKTITQGNSEELIGVGEIRDGILEIVDGSEAYVTEDGIAHATGGDRYTPGTSVRIEPRRDAAEVLRAVGADLEYQFRREEPSSGPNVRKVTVEKSSETVARPLALQTAVTPGADTNIQDDNNNDLDVQPSNTGTLITQWQLGSAAISKVEVSAVDGTTVTGELNDGAALDASEWYTFTFPCRGSGETYNFQIDTGAVQVDFIQVDYTREVLL